jgi:hypothetical protein
VEVLVGPESLLAAAVVELGGVLLEGMLGVRVDDATGLVCSIN